MNIFSKAKDIYKLQAQAKKIKKELHNIHVEGEAAVEGTEEKVLVTVNAELEVVATKVPATIFSSENQAKIEQAICTAGNRALKEAQKIAGEKMKGVMSEMQGLMGGAN